MAEMIQDAISSALSGLWSKVVYYATFSFLDPFYYWLTMGGMAIAALVALAWFFGGLWPAFRAIAGFLVILIAACLYFFRFGENSARQFDKKKRRK